MAKSRRAVCPWPQGSLGYFPTAADALVKTREDLADPSQERRTDPWYSVTERHFVHLALAADDCLPQAIPHRFLLLFVISVGITVGFAGRALSLLLNLPGGRARRSEQTLDPRDSAVVIGAGGTARCPVRADQIGLLRC